MSIHPFCHSVWSRNMVFHSTTIEEHRHIWSVVYCCILWIFWTYHISNKDVRRRTNQPPLTPSTPLISSSLATSHMLIRHSRVLRSSVADLPRDWNCRSGRPREYEHWQLNLMLLHLTLVWTGMEGARGNDNIHRTSHTMMIRYSIDYSYWKISIGTALAAANEWAVLGVRRCWLVAW